MSSIAENNPIPDRTGVADAWRIETTDAAREAHRKEWGHEDGAVGPAWLINGPYHPFWSWWYVTCVHLRPIKGAFPPRRDFPDASHEFKCVALDPTGHGGRPKEPNIEALRRGESMEKYRPKFLSPDFAVQVKGLTDEQAEQILDAIVQRIVEGRSCDSDHRSWWERIIEGTADAYRQGIY